jgi:spore coat protein A, manganese oxidase
MCRMRGPDLLRTWTSRAPRNRANAPILSARRATLLCVAVLERCARTGKDACEMNRRTFMSLSALGGASLLRLRRAWPYAQSPTGLKKFIQALPGLGPTGIPVASPDRDSCPGVDTYRLALGEFFQQLHPDLPATRLWGYADVTRGQSPNHRLLGGVILAQRGRPVRIIASNHLPAKHPLPVDTTLEGAGPDQPVNRATVHLHGAFVPWTSDGGPFSWFTPDGNHGVSFLNPGPKPGQAEYYYPNDQRAAFLWYHDHALGITRLNAYAGLASGYILRDDLEQYLIRKGIIPQQEIPLVLQDKTFVDGTDPNYVFGEKGDLWYPYLYEPDSQPTGRWAYGPDAPIPAPVRGPLPVPSIVPEFFGDTILVNGAVYPYVEVKPQRYRLRILNASQARFFNLQLYYAKDDGGEADRTRPGPAFLQIGTEGGFLPFPVVLNAPPQPIGFDSNGNPNRYTLLLAPAERADVIIDFSSAPAGARLVLFSDAPAPFPMGDDRNDYFTGAPDQSANGGAPTPLLGFGPNTRTLLQFRVLPSTQPALPRVSPHELARSFQRQPLCPDIDVKSLLRRRVVFRDLTLNEDFDDFGRLVQRLGTNVSIRTNGQGQRTFARDYLDKATEVARPGTVEVWRIFNLTGDTHPLHFHLVHVLILSRQPFDSLHYDGTPVFTGPARPADANERGLKETVRANPGECLTVLMPIDLPKVPFAVPESPRTGGFEYVWHCHILEHEEHDMMRPFIVKP